MVHTLRVETIQKTDWYDTPLYYDIIFDEDSEKEADFLEQLNRLHGAGKRKKRLRVLEPACGSGRLIAAMARRGHLVEGFDLNTNMLAYARQRLSEQRLKAHLWQDKLEDFIVPSPAEPYDIAHCSTFKYVLKGTGALSHLKHVAAALRTGGLYVLGFHLTDYTSSKEQHERWVGERNGVHVVCNTHTWPPDRSKRTEDLRTRLRITKEGKTITQETKWQFRTYNADQVRQLLRDVPEFELVTCHDFNYEAHEPLQLNADSYDLVLVLRKTETPTASIIP